MYVLVRFRAPPGKWDDNRTAPPSPSPITVIFPGAGEIAAAAMVHGAVRAAAASGSALLAAGYGKNENQVRLGGIVEVEGVGGRKSTRVRGRDT